MAVLSTLRYSYGWWQASMGWIPVAADYCWGCNQFHGQIHSDFGADNFDWNNSVDRFQVCETCRVSRFCSARCLRTVTCILCRLNAQLIGKSLRQQLQRRRVGLLKTFQWFLKGFKKGFKGLLNVFKGSFKGISKVF